ncbi:bile acid:sodium symporter family protein [Aeromicrobium sp.]|uniref:bile acid:sodium symporter family protein n=1 Tax=Aeromicrobium sp. TaxID=1871063 RepID=UPI003D6B4FFB
MRRLRIDPFIVALVVAALLASFLPATAAVIDVLKIVSLVAIGSLFFLYGTRLSMRETLLSVRHWRLHTVILVTTFVAFPLAGLSAQLLEPAILTPALAAGVLLLCLLPTTVLANIIYTRSAGGNVAGAVVTASLSNLIGVFLTPALAALLMSADADVDTGSVLRIVLLLFVPLVVGQVLRPVIGRWVLRQDRRLRRFERGSIVFVVYVAFSQGANAGIWTTLSVWSVLALVAVCVVLLVTAFGWMWGLGRVLRFSRPDRVAMLFCGSNKSLASGLPLATVLFPGDTLALLLLPLMLYHQLQIVAGAFLATRLARGGGESASIEPGGR